MVFGIFLMIDAGRPRAAVYDLAGWHWYLQYLAPLIIAVALTHPRAMADQHARMTNDDLMRLTRPVGQRRRCRHPGGRVTGRSRSAHREPG